eukprot:3255131-Pleurochrysis_carterae.AAC.1
MCVPVPARSRWCRQRATTAIRSGTDQDSSHAGARAAAIAQQRSEIITVSASCHSRCCKLARPSLFPVASSFASTRSCLPPSPASNCTGPPCSSSLSYDFAKRFHLLLPQLPTLSRA